MRITIIFLLSICLSFFLLLNNYIPFILFALLLYCWCLFKYPEIALYAAILVIFNCFSMMNEDFLRLPYLFRARDIFFLSIFSPMLITGRRNPKLIKYVFLNPIAKGIYFIILIAIIQILVTRYRFPEETFGSIIRTARRYFYYGMFFPALYILLDAKRFNRFIKLTVCGIAIFCLLFIIQFLIGPAHRIFMWAEKIEYQMLHGFSITRIYVDGTMAAALLFNVSFMTMLFCRNFKYWLQNTAIFILTILQILFAFGRANIFGIIAGISFSLAVTKSLPKLRNLTALFLILIFTLILIWIILELDPQGDDLTKAILSRLGSIYTAFSQKEDTLITRIEDNFGRMALVKKHYIFGIGFAHDESRLFAFARGSAESGIRTSDSGILTLLIDMGLVGVIWLLVMTFIFFKRSIYVYRNNTHNFYGPVVLGITAFYFSRLFSFVTLADFVLYDGIVTMAVTFALLEVINYNTSYNANE